MAESLVLSHSVVVIASLVAAVTDMWKFKVYNFLTFPLLFLGLAYHAVVGGGPQFFNSLSGALIGFAVLIVPYVAGGMGAGDVKFLTAIGAWMGTPLVVVVALVGFLGTGLYALVLAVRYHRVRETWLNVKVLFFRLMTIGHYLREGSDLETVQEMATQPERGRRLIPVSAMMAVGVLVALLCKDWLE